MSDALSPNSIEAEEAVLGSVLINPSSYEQVMWEMPLEDGDFFLVRHGWIWQAMRDLHNDKQPIDMLTVVQRLEAIGKLAETGGAAFVLGLINKTPSALNVLGYAGIVLEMASRRALIDVAQSIAASAHDSGTDIGAKIERAKKLLERANRKPKPPLSASMVRNQAFERRIQIEERMKESGTVALKTGLAELDHVTDHRFGFERLLMILGASEHGKSTLMCHMALELAMQCPVLIVSQEMPPVDVFNRMACIKATVPSALLAEDRLNEKQRDSYLEAALLLGDLPIEFMSRQQSVQDVAVQVQQMKARHGGAAGVVFVDTVNKLRNITEDRNGHTSGTATASHLLDALKLDSGWAVVGLVQQYVETNTTDISRLRPSRNNIKDSKALFEDSDLCIGVYNADVWRRNYPGWDDGKCPPGTILLTCLKNRYGDPNRFGLLDWKSGIPALASRPKSAPIPTPSKMPVMTVKEAAAIVADYREKD